MVRAARWILWGNRPAWTLVGGFLFVGIGIGFMLIVRHPDHVWGWLWVGLGAFNVLGGIAGRVVTGTWRKTPRSQTNWLAPLS